MKAEIDDRRRTVDFLNASVENLSAEPTQPARKAALLQRFADIMLHYETVDDELKQRNDVLSTLLSQFEEFGENVESLSDWVDLQMTCVMRLQESLHEATEDDFKVTRNSFFLNNINNLMFKTLTHIFSAQLIDELL